MRKCGIEGMGKCGDPERENRPGGIRLGLERIGIEGGRNMSNFQIMVPGEVVEHEARPITDRIPLSWISALGALAIAQRVFWL